MTMYQPLLPQGDAAALLPGVSYSVPGCFSMPTWSTSAWIR